MGSVIEIDGVSLWPLKRMKNPKGDVWHALKVTDEGFNSFGEAYFSQINPGEIKGWKRHRLVTLNLVVVSGEIEFFIYDDRAGSNTYMQIRSYVLSADNPEKYVRMTVHPGLWMAFKCISEKTAMLLDIMDRVHEDKESDKMDLHSVYFKID